MPTCLFGLILYFLPESLITFPMDKRWIILAAVFFLTFVIPAVGAYFMVRAGVVQNMQMQEREQRRLPFLFTTICYASTTYIFGRENLFGDLFYYIMLLITLSVFAAYVVSLFWKISAHSIGMGGTLGVLVFLHTLLPDAALLNLIVLFILLTGAVMSARLALQEHTPAQVYAGLLTGFAIGAGLVLFL
ncbi:hypothetical protein [Adhaeribacter terreus]|uniref:Phosphatase PAP2 family protein n=1 Tax=Adhaeribacter terreus TaxID=529703 RepID=A0ABW0EDZ2_9BACT